VSAEADAVDVAVVAYRDDGSWYLQELRESALDSFDSISKELRRYPGETGALALIAVDEDWMLLVRVQGSLVRVLLSDATAATDSDLAHSVLDHLGLVVDDEDDQAPAGDLGIVADMGYPAHEMGALMDDFDLYPDELLSSIAQRLGFGDRFDEIAGLSA